MIAKLFCYFSTALVVLSMLNPGSALFAQDYRELFKKLDTSVVTIYAAGIVSGKRGLRPQRSVGSGVIVSNDGEIMTCLLYTSPSPRDQRGSRMPSSA